MLTDNNLIWKAKLDTSQIQRGVTKVKSKLGGLGDKLGGLGGKLGGLVKGFSGVAGAIGVAIAVGTVMVKTIEKIVKVNKVLETSQASLKSILGATADEMVFYRETAISLSTANTQTAVEITNLMKVLGSQKPEILGNAEALQLLTEKTIILSDASGRLAEDTGKDLTGALNQFGEGVEEADRFMNVLAAGSQKYSADIGYLSAAIEKTGKVASDSNMSFEETVGALEVLAPAFSQPTVAGRNFQNTLLNLKKAGAGYESGIFNMGDALDEVKLKYDNLATAQEKDAYLLKMFGQEGITAGKILLDNTEKLKEYTAGVTGTNTAVEQAITNNDTLEASQKKLKNTWDALIYSFNKKNVLTGFFKEIVDGQQKVLTKFIKMKENFSKLFNENIGKEFKELKKPFSELNKELESSKKAFVNFKNKLNELNKKKNEFLAKQAGKFLKSQLEPLKMFLRVATNVVKITKKGFNIAKKWTKEQIENAKKWTKGQIENAKAQIRQTEAYSKFTEILEKLKTKFGEIMDYLQPTIQMVDDFFTPIIDKAKELLKTIGIIETKTADSSGKLTSKLRVTRETTDETQTIFGTTNEADVLKTYAEIETKIKDITQLRIEATKTGLDKQLALLQLAKEEELKKYKDNAEAIKYINKIYADKEAKLRKDEKQRLIDEVKTISKLQIEATKTGLDKELALLQLAKEAEQLVYKDNAEAIKYINKIYADKEAKLRKDEKQRLIDEANELAETLFNLQSESLDKTLTNLEKEYDKKLELAKDNADLIIDIENQKIEAIKEATTQFYQELADQQMTAYAKEQELAKLRFDQTNYNDAEQKKYVLQQQIDTYNKRLEIENKRLENEKTLTEQEIEMINLRMKSAQLELSNLQQTTSILGGIFAQVGKSLEQMNTENINSMRDFSNALYTATKENIKNYLAETVAVSIKNAMIKSGNPALGLILAGASALAIKLMFDKILPSAPKFAKGGIVAGSSTTGDNVLARVNSGERISTAREQIEQTKIYNLVNSSFGKQKQTDLTATNKLLTEQNDLLKSNKTFVSDNGKIFGLNTQSGDIIQRKIL